MRGLLGLDVRETHRVRRWDAVVVGGALPGLVAAARLAMRGAQVLVIEEDSAVAAFAGLTEPFLMTGAANDSVLSACLSAIGIPLIDRRNLASEPLAYQVAWPGARVNIGGLERTADEIECWGLAESQLSRNLLSALEASAAAEGTRLLASRLASATRRGPRRTCFMSRSQTSADAAADRDVEDAIAAAPTLAPLIDAQSRALADFGRCAPGAAARNRLLGAALSGAVMVSGKDPWFASLLRQRIEARHGEFRRLSGTFRIVQTGNLPALAADESRDVSAARALIINAPTSSLVDMGCHTGGNTGSETGNTQTADCWLHGSAPTGRKLRLHLRGSRELLPAGMASRVICVRDASAPMNGTNVVRVRIFQSGDEVDLVADSSGPFEALDAERALEEIRRSVVSLMPLGDEGWLRIAVPVPLWDRSDLLSDPSETDSEPIPGLRRPLSRVPAYILDRSQSARRGFEGDLLLGWQAGDAIATELG
ncbi:MAG: hypothetical protein VCE43_22155 [Myxococcota bacterium]